MDRIIRTCLAALAIVALAGCDNTSANEHLSNAQAQYEQGDIRTAVIELRNALQKEPDLAEARLLLGEALSQLGDHPNALREFERALDLGLDNERVRLGLLRSKANLGRFHEVIGELEDQGPLSAPFAVVLADAYLEADDLTRAQALYRQAADRAEAQLGLGMVAWRQNDLELAHQHLQKAVELDAQSSQAWLRLAEFELSRQRHEAAATAFSRAVEQPGGQLLGHIGRARTYLAQADLDAAREEVAKVLELEPQLPIGHYLDGLVRFEQQDIQGAEAALQEVQRAIPDHAPSLFLMGVIKYRQGQFGQAEENLQRFLAQDRGNESATKLLANMRFERGNHAQVVDLLEPLRSATNDPQTLAMYGAAQMRLGNTAQAVEALQAAVELAPDMAPFRNQLALSLLASGEQSRAEAELQSAIDVDGSQFQSDYLMAMLKIRDEDWDGANAAVNELINKGPDSPIGYNLLGAVALAQEDADKAAAAFEQALERDPGFLPAVRNLARLHEQQGERKLAMERYETFLQEQPGHERALVALAELAVRDNDRPAAESYLRRAVEADTANVMSRLALARIKLGRNELDEAGRLVEEALSQAPEQPDLLLLRAEIELRAGDIAAARQTTERLQRNLADYPDNANLYATLGALQARAGQYGPARGNLETALTLSGDSHATALRTLARLDLRSQDVAAARQRLDTLIAAGDDEPDTRMLRADVLFAENRREEAEALLENLAEDGIRAAVMRLAALELADGSADAAAQRLEAWLQERPGDLGADLLLADALMRHDTDSALARYESLADTGNPVVLNNLAWLYMERGHDGALEMAERAVAAAPDNADILDTLGWILLQQGRVDEAVEQLRRSVQLNPSNPTTQYHLGRALAEAGEPADARRALSRALENGNFPERDSAQQALQRLTP